MDIIKTVAFVGVLPNAMISDKDDLSVEQILGSAKPYDSLINVKNQISTSV